MGYKYIQHRRGTTTQWEEYKDTVPKAGEMVVEFAVDENNNTISKIKIGDGQKTFEELDYVWFDSTKLQRFEEEFSQLQEQFNDITNDITTIDSFSPLATSMAGCLASKASSYVENESNKEYYLTFAKEEDLSGFAVEDIICIDGGNNFPYCAQIKSIDNSSEIKKLFVEASIKDHSGLHPFDKNDEYLVYVPGKQNTGIHPFADTQASLGKNSHAVGIGTAAFGRDTQAGGNYAFVAGRGNKVGNYSTAFGQNNKAFGMKSFACGQGNQTKGLSSFASGQDTKANGEYSATFGRFTQANGSDSLALGYESKANGYCSLATGSQTTAKGRCSFTGGQGAIADGELSIALGKGVQALKPNEIALGQFNKIDDQAIFSIGNGDGENELRSNAFVIHNDNTAYLGNYDKDNNSNQIVVKQDIVNFIKNTDYASKENFGIIKIGAGLGLDANNNLQIEYATNDQIKNKKGFRNPLSLEYIDLIVKTGLINNTINLEDDEQASIQSWLGIGTLINTIDSSLASQSKNISDLNSNIAELRSKIQYLEGNMSQLEQRLSQLENS